MQTDDMRIDINGTREVVTITVKVEPDGRILARSVEMIGGAARVRFSFPPDGTVDSSFSSEAAPFINNLIGKVLNQDGMLAMPDSVLRLTGLSLAECSVITASVRDGGQQIMIRFSHFLGDLFSLFASDYPPRRRLSDPAAAQAVALMEEAYIPLVNFSEYVKELQRAGELTPGETLSDALLAVTQRIQAMAVCQFLAKEVLRGAPPTDAAARLVDLRVGDAAMIDHWPDNAA